MPELSNFEKNAGFHYDNRDLFREAVTHRSYLNENPSWPHPHNERLEFLGDAVLELAVTESLYKRYEQFPEGKLTLLRASLVNYQFLARLAGDLGLEKEMLMSRGESRDIGKAREVILANAMEAIVGALYLDKGFEAAKEFTEKHIMPHVAEIVASQSYKDPKSRLQEVVQEKHKITPSYKVLSEDGPAHARVFRMGVYVSDRLLGEGEGASKQEAEVEAARCALEQNNG
jgi:ribonuclease-3